MVRLEWVGLTLRGLRSISSPSGCGAAMAVARRVRRARRFSCIVSWVHSTNAGWERCFMLAQRWSVSLVPAATIQQAMRFVEKRLYQMTRAAVIKATGDMVHSMHQLQSASEKHCHADVALF